MKKLIKKAKAIVTCNAKDEVFYNSDLLVDGNRIIEIGEALTPEGEYEVIDGEGCFVYPGLVNTHHHMFQAFTRNISALEFNKGITLFNWLTYCYKIWQHLDNDYIYHSSLVGMADGIKFGMTTNFDQFYAHPAPTRQGLMDSQYRAVKDIGIRFHAGRSCMTMTQKDGGLPPDIFGETTEEVLEDMERLVASYHSNDFGSMYQVVAAPCSPFTTATDTYREVVKQARDLGIRLHSHLAEDSEEIDYMLERYGKRSLAWAQEVGLFGDDVWYAHGPYFNKEELKEIGEAGSGITYCPLPMLILGAEILDIPTATDLGVTIGLGTDGQGVQDGSNMLEVMRVAYLAQCQARGLGHDPGPTAYEALKLACRGGSKLLGRKDIGYLDPGMAADLFLVNTNKLELVGSLEDPKSFLAKVGYNRTVDLTMINGEVVYRDGVLQTIDEEKVRRDATQIVEKVLTYI